MELPIQLASLTGFMLSKCASFLTNDLEKEIAEFGIKVKHYAILLVLAEKVEINQKNIGQLLFLDRNTTVLLIDELENLGYALRERNPNDRRAHFIILSAKGKQILPKINKKVGEIERRQLEYVTESEKIELNKILNKIMKYAQSSNQPQQ